MKSIKKIVWAAAFFAVLVFQTDSIARVSAGLQQVANPATTTTTSVDEVLTTEREKIQQLTIDTEKIKAAAADFHFIAIN